MRSLVLAFIAGCAFSAAHGADRYPHSPVTIVVPFPPGGTTDVISRAIQPALSKRLGVPVVVENRPGANGSLGATMVARSKPDGQTLVMGATGVFATNHWLYKSPTYIGDKDFAFITNAAHTPNVLVVHPEVPARTLAEFIALTRNKPGTVTFASSGIGSTSHLCGEMLKLLAGIDISHIPYKGPSQANHDLMAGRVSSMCDAYTNVAPLVRQGRLRAIAISAPQRAPAMPEVQTFAEAGLPGLHASAWFGFAAPAGTSREVTDLLQREIAAALKSPDTRRQLESGGLTIVADTPGEFNDFVQTESAKWRGIIRNAGISAD